MNSNSSLPRFFSSLRENPRLILGMIIAAAILFFEIFNFSTTEFALHDLLGDLRFAGVLWSTALSIAFCAIDFAGLARLFIPDHDDAGHNAVWYLFGAWLLAATMNAALTWWGVSMAIVNHSVKSTAIVDASTILTVVPIFVAIMVWVIRILIIGSISVAGNKVLFGGETRRPRPSMARAPLESGVASSTIAARPLTHRAAASTNRPSSLVASSANRPEPTYHSLSMNARSSGDANSSGQMRM